MLHYNMKKLRWSTTLVFVAAAAGLLSLVAFSETISTSSRILIILAVLILIIMALFGRRGV